MTAAVREPRTAFRDGSDSMLGGVASGLARHLGTDPLTARVGFVLLALLGGFGVVVYAALWVLMPVGEEASAEAAPGIASATRRGFRTSSRRAGSRRDASIAWSLSAVAIGCVVLLQNAGLWISPRIFWPLAVAAVGAALLWWQSDRTSRTEWLSTRNGWKAWLRVLLGVVLIASAVWLSLFTAGVQGAIDDVLGAIVFAVVGVALVIGPWLLRLNRDLRSERRERVRSQERADVAAHLHDSVLQTLALIQRQSGDPQRVSQLARTQERELRAWLFDASDAEGTTLRAALSNAAAEVEDLHLVPVELVVVGDASADDRTAALVAAAREAMVNAARHSGAGAVDVYAEVGPTRIEVGVRDRGVGFDPTAIAPDRHGVRRSIVERMQRHGGDADVRSSPGEGTEVRMWIPTTSSEAER